MDELSNGCTLHYSQDDGSTFQAITEIDICKRCGKRTIMCPHKIPKENIITLPTGTSHVKIVRVEPVHMAKLFENVKSSLLETVTNIEEVWDEMEFKEMRWDLKEQHYNTRKQELAYPNPRTVSHELESFGYKATQLWSKIPNKIQQADNLSTFKNEISKIV